MARSAEGRPGERGRQRYGDRCQPGDIRPWWKERHGSVRRNGRYVQAATRRHSWDSFRRGSPQYVVLVKLDNPAGCLLRRQDGGAGRQGGAAGRDFRARRVARSWRPCAQRARYVPPAAELDGPRRHDSRGDRPRRATTEPDAAASLCAVDSTPLAAPGAGPLRPPCGSRAGAAAGQVTIPDVRGNAVRVAARELHRAGLRVSFCQHVGFEVSPPPGTLVAGGTPGAGGASVNRVFRPRHRGRPVAERGTALVRQHARSLYRYHGRQPAGDQGRPVRRGAWQHVRRTRLPRCRRPRAGAPVLLSRIPPGPAFPRLWSTMDAEPPASRLAPRSRIRPPA